MTFYSRPYKSPPYVNGKVVCVEGKTRVELIVYSKAIFKWYLLLPVLVPLELILAGSWQYHNPAMVQIGFCAVIFLTVFYAAIFSILRSILLGRLKTLLNLNFVS